MFGKLMSISDELMWRYFELLSFRPLADVAALRHATTEGRNPRDVKFELARELVARFHDEAAAEAAQRELYEEIVFPQHIARRRIDGRIDWCRRGWTLSTPHLRARRHEGQRGRHPSRPQPPSAARSCRRSHRIARDRQRVFDVQARVRGVGKTMAAILRQTAAQDVAHGRWDSCRHGVPRWIALDNRSHPVFCSSPRAVATMRTFASAALARGLLAILILRIRVFLVAVLLSAGLSGMD